MEQRTSPAAMLKSLPLAHQVVIGIAAAILVMAGYFFFNWVSTPSMTVLFTDLDEANLATVVDELDRLGIPYEIDGGGSPEVHAMFEGFVENGIGTNAVGFVGHGAVRRAVMGSDNRAPRRPRPERLGLPPASRLPARARG